MRVRESKPETPPPYYIYIYIISICICISAGPPRMWSIPFVPPREFEDEMITVHVGRIPLEVVGRSSRGSVLHYPHEDSLNAVEQGITPRFLEDPDPTCRYLLSVLDLPFPHPRRKETHAKSCTRIRLGVHATGVMESTPVLFSRPIWIRHTSPSSVCLV